MRERQISKLTFLLINIRFSLNFTRQVKGMDSGRGQNTWALPLQTGWKVRPTGLLPHLPRCWSFHVCRIKPNQQLTARGSSLLFLDKMNPRNLNHLTLDALKRMANFAVSLPCFKQNGMGEGEPRDYTPLTFSEFQKGSPPKRDALYLSSLLILQDVVYPLLYTCVELCVGRWIGS